MKSGIYTGVNGPMYGNAGNGQAAMHHFISDHILGLQPWLDNNTMCSFPYPWANQSRTPNQNRKSFKYRIMNGYNTGEQNWYQAYTGAYGHRFFGNVTVTYNQTLDVLEFKVGKYGEGFLHWLENEVFAVNLTGATWYLQHTGDPDPPPFMPPVMFQNKQNGMWMEAVSTAHEMSVFRRGVKWSDPDPPRPTYFPPSPTCPMSSAPGLSLSNIFYCIILCIIILAMKE